MIVGADYMVGGVTTGHLKADDDVPAITLLATRFAAWMSSQHLAAAVLRNGS